MTLTLISKTCSKCGEELPATTEYFYRRPEARDGWRGHCKKCIYRANRTKKAIIYRAIADKRYRSTVRGHLFQVFANMRKRCYDISNHRYHRYGGRGIKIRFVSVNEFVDYVINELQVDPRGLTIDRIDNDGDYEPGNIRFTTNFDNCQNRDNYRYNQRKRGT